MTEPSPCVFCQYCHLIDEWWCCSAVGYPDIIEEPMTDLRPCKMYKTRSRE